MIFAVAHDEAYTALVVVAMVVVAMVVVAMVVVAVVMVSWMTFRAVSCCWPWW